ncbi:terpene cyclase/mutase family protein [Candidatus Berkelbacteria bacterium]|nr:terpene cyclase/mutase family protein [Candidatus Berkelbacteria bacterium]
MLRIVKVFYQIIICSFVLAVLVLVSVPWAVFAQARNANQAIELARSSLLNTQNADGSIGDGGTSDWAAMALAAAATNDPRFTSLKTYIAAQAGRVDKNSATELERTILALTAIGVNPYNIGNRNLIDELKALATGGQIGSPNFVNDDIFAILAFRAAGQDPTSEPFKSVIDFVKHNQLASGGFNDRVGGQEADIDITAVAAVALAPYHNTASIKNVLTSAQNSDGGFPSRAGSSSNVASTAWTIWAIGLNQRATEYLINQQQPSGSFGSILGTSYGLHALTGKSLPVGFVNAPAQPQPIPAEIIQPTPLPTPTPTQKPDVIPVNTPGVFEPVTQPQPEKNQERNLSDAPGASQSVPQPKKAPAKRPQPLPQKTNQPLATPVASVNRGSNLLLVTSNTYPKETLAQTYFEAQTVRPPQLIQPKNPLRNIVPYTLAIGAVTLASVLAIALLWRTSRPSELIQPRLALA